MDELSVGKILLEKGWVFSDSVLDTAMISKLNQDLETACDQTRQIQVKNGVAEKTDGTVNHLLGLGDSFLEFLERMDFKEVITEFLSGKYILNIFGGVNNLKDKPSYLLDIHRDVRSFTGDYKLMIQMLVLLDDFTPENGATYLMDGGHRIAQRPTETEFYANAKQAIGSRGSIVLFDSNLWHAAGANQTDRPRRALTLCFTRPFIKQQLDLPRYFGYDQRHQFSEEIQQILGYNALVPTCLEEWYQPPQKRFYQPGQG